MPASTPVAGLATSFNLPNYGGELFTVAPDDTRFLSAIGGLSQGGAVVDDYQIEWQADVIADPELSPALEGADAPAGATLARGNFDNIVEIYHDAFEITYTRQAATARMAGINNNQANPVTNEIAHQTMVKLRQAGIHWNKRLLTASYNKPATNAAARSTRGLLNVPTTNARANLGPAIAATAAAATDAFTANGHGLTAGGRVRLSSPAGGLAGITAGVYVVRDVTTNTFKLASSAGGAAIDITADGTATIQLLQPLTRVAVLDFLQGIWATNGIVASLQPTLMVGAELKRGLTKLFVTDMGYQEQTRNVGGVSMTTIITEFGDVNVLLERNIPATTLAFSHLALCKPVFLLIPEKGFLFVEPLAKTGAKDKFQLYGECGLEYGPEMAHGKIEDCGAVAGA